MLSVTEMWEDIRGEGLNCGLPTLFLKLGPGYETTPEDLVREVVLSTQCKWCTILGPESTRVGVGSLVKGLTVLGMKVEIEVDGRVKEPNWLHTVDRWIVDYVEEGVFNYGSLRSQDMIRFTITGEGDLSFAGENLEKLKSFAPSKYLLVKYDCSELSSANLLRSCFLLAKKYDRCRVFKVLV